MQSQFVETMTPQLENQLHASSFSDLRRKVAQSNTTYHKDFPRTQSVLSYHSVDPTHQTTHEQENLCLGSDADETTVFSALIGFPFLPKNRQNTFDIHKLVKYAKSSVTDELLETNQGTKVLFERERRRMNAVKSKHPYGMENFNKLTVDANEKILIRARQAAESRYGYGNVGAEEVREVLTYSRNNHLRTKFDGDVTEITEDDIIAIENKTCSPVLPATSEQKTVLLYWIDNPDATLTDVLKETGVNRGKFETFRLNLPNPQCYDRDVIESLTFDTTQSIYDLHDWMANAPYEMYDCDECLEWMYSKSGFNAHKSQKNHHNLPNTENPYQRFAVTEITQQTQTDSIETVGAETDAMMEQFSAIQSDD